MSHGIPLKTLLICTAACAFCFGVAKAEPLPQLNLEAEETTVSGLSSGAFMAVQLQVAFSNVIAGAGVIAGGPFDCAERSVWQALHVCMDPFFSEPDPADSVAAMRDLAARGGIDPLEGIASDRLYLFHGRRDDTVARATMDALEQSYRALGVPAQAMEYTVAVDAGHGFLTERGPVACAETRPDFLNDCGIDQAGDILEWLYGPLADAVPARDEGLRTFEQSLYIEGAKGMDAEAFVYVPADCAAGEICRLHIALHGCRQGRETIGEDYVRLTGYNRWAESNRIVVLYPQAVRIPSPWYNWFAGNPKGCWDWWGYSGTDYLSRSAPQVSAIARMAAALGAPLTR